MKNIRIFMAMLLISMMFIAPVRATSYDFAELRITLLNQDPDPAEQGKYLELRWKVEKMGNMEMKNVSFYLDAKYPFSFDASDSPMKYIGNWKVSTDENEYYTLYYKVKVAEDALEGTYKVKLRIHDDRKGDYYSNEFEILVGEKQDVAFALGTLVTTPSKLFGDSEENKLEVTLTNVGKKDGENVLSELVLPEGFKATYAYSDRSSLGTISAGSSSTATYYIDVDKAIPEGNYPAKVKIHYKEANDDTNEYRETELPLNLPVSGKPKLEIVSVASSPEKIEADSKVEIRFVIKNVGTKEAESSSVMAFKETSQPFEFDEKSDFIGKLQPGEQGEAVLKFTVDKEATAKDFIVDLELRSIYNNEVITDDAVTTIKVENGTKKSIFDNKNLVMGMIALLVIVVGMIAYYAGKRSK